MSESNAAGAAGAGRVGGAGLQATPVGTDEYRQLLHGSPLPVVVHGPDSRVRDANEAFADLLGYTLDEALTLQASDVIAPDQLAERDRQAAELLCGSGALTTRRRLIRKDGSSIWARVHKSAIRRGGETVVMVFLEDWTDAHWQHDTLP